MGRDQQSTQTFVMVAMGLVTGAVAVGMYRHGGFPGPVAATAALAIYVLLLTVHALIVRAGNRRRSTAASNPGADARASREPEAQGRILGGRAGARRIPQNRRARRRAVDGSSVRFAQAPAQGRPGPSAQEDTLLLREAVAPRGTPRREEPGLSPAAHALMQGEPNPQAMHDYWSFRPAAPRLDLPPLVGGGSPASIPEPALPGAGAPADANSAERGAESTCVDVAARVRRRDDPGCHQEAAARGQRRRNAG